MMIGTVKQVQSQYTDDKEPEFYSDNDSFLIVLKNLNYKKETGKVTIINRKQFNLSVAIIFCRGNVN